MCADIAGAATHKVFLPKMDYSAATGPKVGSRVPNTKGAPSSTMQALAGAAGGVFVVTAVRVWSGAPEGFVAGMMQALPPTVLLFGGPLALGILAAQMLDVDKGQPIIGAALASGLAVGGMMLTNMLPREVDMATLNTIAAAAVGVYAGEILC